jgi:hypothetical protein
MASTKKINAIKPLKAPRFLSTHAKTMSEPSPLPIPGRKSRSADRSILMLDPLFLDQDGKVIARIADISLNGALLYSRGTPFSVGAKLSGWLDSPALGAFDEVFVAVWLTVAWTRKDGDHGWFKSGCSFEDAKEAEQNRLTSLINALKVNPPQAKLATHH